MYGTHTPCIRRYLNAHQALHGVNKRYMVSTKNVGQILGKMVDGVAPPKFSVDHLKAIGNTSSNDRAIIPLLKDLGFLSPDGTPTKRYHAYRDKSRSKAVMAEALRDAYTDVFQIREIPTKADRAAIEGLFKSKHNSTDRVAKEQASTFLALLEHADLTATPVTLGEQLGTVEGDDVSDNGNGGNTDRENESLQRRGKLSTELHYTIQVHLPATKDLEVYNAIFKSLKDNLLP